MNTKFGFAIILSLCSIIQMISQEKSTISCIEKYKQFGLVWGLMKYHHSEVSKGTYNWDQTFVENVDKLEGIDTQEKLNEFLLNFVLSIKVSKIKIASDTEDFFKKNVDYDWIEMYSANNELYLYLKQLKDNTSISDYYVSNQSLSKIPIFKNEKGFKSFDYRNKSHRLLELLSFWNAIQYHYVNKYLMDKNWLSQLEYFIDDFSKCSSQLEFELAKTKLIVSLNDSHSYYISKLANDSLFTYKPPFGVRLVNDTLVVTNIHNKKLGEKDDLKPGDLIVKINDTDIKTVLNEKVGTMISCSNGSFLKKWARWLFFSKEDSIKVNVKRKDIIITKYLHLYNTYEVKDYASLPFFIIEKKWQLIDDNIGYINLKTISKEEIQKAFEEFSNTDGIIIDLRNYPKNVSLNDVTKHTYPDKKEFIKVLFAMPNRPSIGKFEKPIISALIDPFKSGSENSNYYKGKIILLVDHTTQSMAEFTGMGIQASPTCITVGETTAGSVMNIATFIMPDGTEAQFTSMGAFYPDGTGVQRKGLKIDYYVNENTSNFTKDQYIIKGIELIKSTKNKEN
ncbi:S41 family peptidase [Flavobacterium daemonense]|uniref:S41 family peptidase n=1 Tax=Flavobacterium daemonense TaxID=1393049 RepID=UPI00118510D7|nr:S41 family peptidase [Flavobacterium daemonense]KAF2329084.1 hypothetical protein FND99_17295 [Flavobacterium daemonense]